jgi:dTDP-4-amino-4,6-dideoxygalactose transaminase
MSDVKFLDLKAQYLAIKEEVDAAVIDVLESTAYILGPKVESFEKAFAHAHGADYGVAVNTGTSALHLALLAESIGGGDEVITVPMTFTATVAAISYTGATPVFVDVSPETFTMDPTQIAAKITPRTRAILPVHLYGQAADMDPILEIARTHSLKVIEDCAQAHLATYKGRPVGSIGDYGCFSFYPGKNLGAYGEGGLVTTKVERAADKMRLLRDWGQVSRYHHEMLAYNYRMDGIQGAVLGVKLKYLNSWTEQRRSRAALYRELLDGSGIAVTTEAAERRHVYHIFSVFHAKRDQLQAYLSEAGIQSGMHYPFPVHLQKAYAHLDHKPGDFPVSERVAKTQLSLPMYPELSDGDIVRIAHALKSFT